METRLAVEVRDGSGGEFDACLSDIHFTRNHGNAHSFQVGDGRVHKREQDIQVVNHHVIHHIDIETPRRKDAQPVDFEKHRTRNNRLCGDHSRIKAFQVADLQDAGIALGGGYQLVGFLERSSHGLFDQHVHAGFEHSAACRSVALRGNGDADGIRPFRQQGVFAWNHARAEFGGDFRGAARIGVDNPHQLHAFNFAPDAHVVAPEFPYTNHCDADRLLDHVFFLISNFDAAGALSGAKAWIAMPASSAARIRASLSNSNVRRASMASAEAFA